MAVKGEVPLNVLARYFRVPTGGTPVSFRGKDELWSSVVTNVSVSGVFIRTTQPLAVGTLLSLEFSLPDGGPTIACEAVVRWVAGVETKRRRPTLNVATSMGMGLEFSEISRPHQKAIEKYVKTFLAKMRKRR